MALDVDQLLNSRLLHDCKVHAARWNGEDEPLDVFLRSRTEWLEWNSWRNAKDEFNRTYICSFIQFYPEEMTWLFGGFFKVIKRGKELGADGYDIKLCSEGSELIGRLKFVGKVSRGRAFLADTFFRSVVFSEILKEPYCGEVFKGFENCSLDFKMLEILVKNSRADWKTALQNVNGIYLIADKANGKKYVGSAYGKDGIWTRWSQYVANGHGWNKELVGLTTSTGISYARENFRFTLLESWPFQTDKKIVLARERHWKEVLLTREFGYNAN
jgi:GIY-YIG catalytic domain